MDAVKTVVVALGGNAITRENQEGNIYEQFLNTRQSLEGVLELTELGHRVLITHGNGPQIGNELIRVEEAVKLVPTLPLGVLVGDTQGGMGYMIEQCLQNVLHDRGIEREVACMITQMEVDRADPAFKNPTKFVGPFYTREKAEELQRERGWAIKEDKGRGYRRVVPSPLPKEVIEGNIIRMLLDSGVVVIAAGGGGIPVYRDSTGWLEGLDAVIDKDLASALLGNQVGADELMILTGVDQVAVNYGKPDQRFLDSMTIAEAEAYLAEGQFPPGSMGPKISAAINFLRGGGRRVVISSIEKSALAVYGKAGTVLMGE
ncbi:MAG: carbamate kinase [Calditrichaeota bacterium]|nr:carbamate kinase [Calditrichota bacterium]MCB0297381.1 carbamate kinase [Calditrichota bacterium]MCB0303540.1 carbamate kinase [Calditrichota bacterium]